MKVNLYNLVCGREKDDEEMRKKKLTKIITTTRKKHNKKMAENILKKKFSWCSLLEIKFRVDFVAFLFIFIYYLN